MMYVALYLCYKKESAYSAKWELHPISPSLSSNKMFKCKLSCVVNAKWGKAIGCPVKASREHCVVRTSSSWYVHGIVSVWQDRRQYCSVVKWYCIIIHITTDILRFDWKAICNLQSPRWQYTARLVCRYCYMLCAYIARQCMPSLQRNITWFVIMQTDHSAAVSSNPISIYTWTMHIKSFNISVCVYHRLS